MAQAALLLGYSLCHFNNGHNSADIRVCRVQRCHMSGFVNVKVLGLCIYRERITLKNA